MTVDAWLVRIDCTRNEQRVTALLSAEERARADRFRFGHDRTRYVNAHGLMREILSNYLHVDAADLRITHAAGGKPGLGEQHRSDVQFNLSHSGQYGALAVSIGPPVGVDVEVVRPDMDWAELADRYFSGRENAWLRTHPPDEAVRWFFRLWVAKEAVLKTRGVGLSAGLRDVEVPAEGAGDAAAAGGPLWISELVVPSGYAAALAIRAGEAPTVQQVTLNRCACHPVAPAFEPPSEQGRSSPVPRAT
jgi:4'-phosphopantetheinyl transferase